LASVTESFTQCVMTMMIFSTFNATDFELFPKNQEEGRMVRTIKRPLL
jgi:hypothetical protein